MTTAVRAGWVGGALVAGAIGLSAFLLFTVELLVGRVVLPAFGGTPTAWTTVLCFFQAVLLGGYLYGHVSVNWLGVRRGTLVHLALAALAIGALILAPVKVADLRVEGVPEALNLLGILALVVGLPAFVLTATTPLLSAWLVAALRRSGGKDPYRLYVLSNAGSLAGLLAYPAVVEPRLGLGAQRLAWAIAFGAFAALLAVVALWTRWRVARADPEGPVEGAVPTAGATAGRAPTQSDPTWTRRGRWLLLAAVPSGLLSAVTNFVATDLVSAPLLWVGPLALYLASFIVAFSPRAGGAVRAAVLAAPAAATLLWIPLGSAGGWPILPLLVVAFGAFAVVATALHGRLADDVPGSARLTEFYLVLALGGVLGGTFVAVVAPLAFQGVWEYPILIVAALVALAVSQPTRPAAVALPLSVVSPPRAARAGRPRLDFRPFFVGVGPRLLPYAVVGGALAVLLATEGALAAEAGLRWLLVGGLLLLVGGAPRFLATSTAVVLVLAVFVLSPPTIFRERSFFGVTEVLHGHEGATNVLMNGTTVHGEQWIDPARHREPIGYYARSGPLNDIFALAHSASVGPGSADVASAAPGAGAAAAQSGRDIGIAGLGAGGIAAYAGPGDALTYFEIDPVVVRVANDPRLFTYLAETPIPPTIVMGDARRSIEDVPDASYDLLILDAFSSDSVPTHLLTAEALVDAARTVRPSGILLVHVSNRYYELAPPVAGGLEAAGLQVRIRRYAPSPAEAQAGANPSIWVVGVRDPALALAFDARGWAIPDRTAAPTTDDFPDVLRFLRFDGF